MRFTFSTLGLVSVFTLTAAVVAACGDDETQSAATQGSGASTSVAATGTGGGAAGGAGGAAGSAGTAGGGGSMCHGDQAAWDAIEKMDLPCQSSSDCCVVVNNCTSEAQVVGSADSAAAAAAWPYCDSDCVDCQPPMIELECKTGKCIGYFPDPDPTKPPETGTNHCGQDGTAPMGGKAGLHFDCSG